MDLLDSLNILIRRWVLTVPLLMLTLAGVAAGYAVLPWSYKAQSTVVFLSSPYQAKQAGGNPWLLFDSSLTVTAEVVGREVMGDTVAAQMKARGLTSSYEVMIAPDSVGPVLSIDVTGSQESDVRTTLDTLTQVVVQSLDRIQADDGVTERARITASVVTTMPPTRQSEDKLRLLVMALFAGLVTTIVVPLFVEALAARRRRGAEVLDPLPPVRPERPRPARGGSGSHPGPRPPARRRPDPARIDRAGPVSDEFDHDGYDRDGLDRSRAGRRASSEDRFDHDGRDGEEPERVRPAEDEPRTDPSNGSWSSPGPSGHPRVGRTAGSARPARPARPAKPARPVRPAGSGETGEDEGDPDYLAYYLSPPVPPGAPPAERDA